MSLKPVTIYTASSWEGCAAAKAWLSQAGIPYTEVDTSADPAKRDEMIAKAGGTWITPAIVVGEAVGLGFDPEWLKARLKGWAALRLWRFTPAYTLAA